MSARRHLCCYQEPCDNVATVRHRTGYYCGDHCNLDGRTWDAMVQLVDGFDPTIDSAEEIRAARHVLVRNGVIRVG